ncbi:MAG: hypothetical protein ACRYHQ_35775 [Janthinobacterium lividum]
MHRLDSRPGVPGLLLRMPIADGPSDLPRRFDAGGSSERQRQQALLQNPTLAIPPAPTGLALVENCLRQSPVPLTAAKVLALCPGQPLTMSNAKMALTTLVRRGSARRLGRGVYAASRG